jgi:hypothetical protein
MGFSVRAELNKWAGASGPFSRSLGLLSSYFSLLVLQFDAAHITVLVWKGLFLSLRGKSPLQHHLWCFEIRANNSPYCTTILTYLTLPLSTSTDHYSYAPRTIANHHTHSQQLSPPQRTPAARPPSQRVSVSQWCIIGALHTAIVLLVNIKVESFRKMPDSTLKERNVWLNLLKIDGSTFKGKKLVYFLKKILILFLKCVDFT